MGQIMSDLPLYLCDWLPGSATCPGRARVALPGPSSIAAQGRLQGTPGERPGPEVVAQTIADAVEGKEQKLRWPVGDDANLILDVRKAMSDEDFEATMRSQLQLDW